VDALLDTHTLIWATTFPPTLSSNAAEFIASNQNRLFVSAASAWEIATKVRIGKLPGAEGLERDFIAIINRAGYLQLPIAAINGLEAGRMQGKHKDPFDRMIAAQALALDIPVISNDAELDTFGVRRIW